MSFEHWMLYSTTIFFAAIIPGPSMVLALTHGMKYGARRTVVTALGNVTASLLQAAISIAGLSAILTTSAHIFLVIKWFGGGYLLYLGIKLWRTRDSIVVLQPIRRKATQVSLSNMFFQAFLVTAGNPKAIVFFTALFPQFIDTKVSQGSQFCVIMVTLALIAFFCFMLYAVGGQKLVSVVANTWIGRYINKILGGVFIGTGLGLATNKH
jgi:homoserine/homoserine lactone efflux protein